MKRIIRKLSPRSRAAAERDMRENPILRDLGQQLQPLSLCYPDSFQAHYLLWLPSIPRDNIILSDMRGRSGAQMGASPRGNDLHIICEVASLTDDRVVLVRAGKRDGVSIAISRGAVEGAFDVEITLGSATHHCVINAAG